MDQGIVQTIDPLSGGKQDRGLIHIVGNSKNYGMVPLLPTHSSVALLNQPIDDLNGINLLEIISEDGSNDDLIVSKIAL